MKKSNIILVVGVVGFLFVMIFSASLCECARVIKVNEEKVVVVVEDTMAIHDPQRGQYSAAPPAKVRIPESPSTVLLRKIIPGINLDVDNTSRYPRFHPMGHSPGIGHGNGPEMMH